jgi:hypothetical protein
MKLFTMADRDTEILVFTYFLAILLIIGLIFIICSYTAWFRPRGSADERRSFVETINRGVSVSHHGSSESDRLLGGGYV